MGVNGLWTVVQPCARPTNLATLNRKRLAVDASIWIYQFLKAVRDKEGNALRNSHVVGFFRRICKLLWFGIRPVFVFDGGAPALKRATLQARARRREGRREDAVRTAGRLLAVQMQRIAEEDAEGRRQRRATATEGEDTAPEVGAPANINEPEEAIPSADKLVYVEELGMSAQERQRSRRFHKQDAYHLPELETAIEAMGRPEDPRIMSIEELEEYARQFHAGEDINLYDFSKIDFDGDFFKSLPPADRYNILNAARIRSRLRMGLSKTQLDEMFPDRMAFSRFQIERVKERNHLTQRLMYEVGMTGTDLTVGVNARVAGERNREYILVKNEGAEGGWALGVVSREKDRGEIQNPIDVDRLEFQYQGKDEEEEWEDDDAFVDVPIEGLNRLPKPRSSAAVEVAREAGAARRAFYNSRQPGDGGDGEGEDSLFVGGDDVVGDGDLFGDGNERDLEADEDEDLNRAIVMSLQNQHGVDKVGQDAEEEEESEEAPAPAWSQKAVAAAKPISRASGRMVAHIVNNRANAAVPKRRASNASSDSDVDLQTALAAARKKEKAPAERAPIRPNVAKPFDGPLPFEKIDWRKTIFAKAVSDDKTKAKAPKISETGSMEPDSDEEELEGGFQRGDAPDPNESLPLPPWLVGETDIRDSVKKQQEMDLQINTEDHALAEEEAQILRRKHRDAIIEIDTSDDESDVEIIDAPTLRSLPDSPVSVRSSAADERLQNESETAAESSEPKGATVNTEAREATPGQDCDEQAVKQSAQRSSPRAESPDIEFEDVALPNNESSVQPPEDATAFKAPVTLDIELPDVMPPVAQQHRREGLAAPADIPDGELIPDAEFDEFSDPEEEQLLAQMAEEAEEHARFASTLNNKSERENQEAYERELRALRTQQKKDRRDADEVTQIMVAECQSLLRLFGIPYITAPMEAEAQCAELVQLGLVDGIVTDDSDTFLFGGTRIYKNMFNSNKFVECYLSSDLDKELSLSREQLVSLALLLGSDYTEGLAGIGPVTAVEILSEFPGTEGLAAFREWWQDVQVHGRPKDADASSTFRRKFRKSHATKLFLPPGFPSPAVADAYLEPQVDSNPEPFQWGVPNLEGLRDFLMATIGWGQERTDEVLVPVIKDMNRREVEGTQSNITRYFEGSVGVGAKEAFAPRQRAKGSKRMLDAVSRLRAKTGGETALSAGAGDAGNVSSAGPAKSTSRKRKKNRAIVPDGSGDDDDYEELDSNAKDSEVGDQPPLEAELPSGTRAKRAAKGKKKAKA